MADILNLETTSNRNIIEDGTTPALTLENTSSGNCLRLQNAGGTGISLSILSCPTTALNVGAGGIAVTGSQTFTGDQTVTGSLTLNGAGETNYLLSLVSCPTTAFNVATGGAAITGNVAITGDVTTTGDSTLRSTTTESNVLSVGHQTALSSATVAPFSVFTSTPSGPLVEFAAVDKGVVSTASGCVTVSYGVRVKVGDTYGWVYVYPTLA